MTAVTSFFDQEDKVAVNGQALPNTSWESVAQGLSQYYPGTISEDFASRVAEGNSAAALASFLGQSADGIQSFGLQHFAGEGVAAAPGGTVARAFWWGFHVQFSHEDIQWILDSADLVNNAVVAIGGSIPSPAQPWIRLIGPFVSLVHQQLRALDRGYGIYISMSWFAPGLFVPTSV